MRISSNSARQPPSEEIIMPSTRETRHELGKAAAEVADAAKESVADARDRTRQFGARLRDNGAQLEEELRDAGRRFSDGARQFGSAASDQIRQHPLAAFGIAFAAGVLLSRCLRGPAEPGHGRR
jgi:ElaB/YqjD/DUF883 family membrane-anchored ribosome-binding protein